MTNVDQEEIITRLKKMNSQKRMLRLLSEENKNSVLMHLRTQLQDKIELIFSENQKDIELYKSSHSYQKAFEDRLTLTQSRIQSMIDSLKQVEQLPNPVGQISNSRTLPNGLQLSQVRSPLGAIFMIFESRPNVITEAFSLAFKSGNVFILKGGKESTQTSKVIYECIYNALQAAGVSKDIFWGLEEVSREWTDFMMLQNQFIDVLIPRGGDRLIEHVTQNSRIPIIKNDRGLCHLYIHEEADLTMGLQVLINGKTQRPGVCNSIETLLIDESKVIKFLPNVFEALVKWNVQYFICDRTLEILNQFDSGLKEKYKINRVEPKSFDTEYLDYKLNIRTVSDWTQAVDHIDLHGSKHSEAIITNNSEIAKCFEESVDAAVVYWNASTRFTDGGQFGFGGEIGISTQKLHVRGPVGLEALTSLRWIAHGKGQIRL